MQVTKGGRGITNICFSKTSEVLRLRKRGWPRGGRIIYIGFLLQSGSPAGALPLTSLTAESGTEAASASGASLQRSPA